MIIVFEISLILLFCLTLAHGILRFDTKRLLLSFTIIAVIMAIEENLVMLLTHDYAYYGYYLWIGEFPVCIMLAWVVISYLGFLLASKYNNVILGTATASSVDLILEPAARTWQNIFYIIILCARKTDFNNKLC